MYFGPKTRLTWRWTQWYEAETFLEKVAVMPSFLTNMDQQLDISSEPVSFKCTVNRCEVSKVLWRQLVYFVKSEHIYLQSPNYWENFVSFGEATIENF